MLTFMNSKPHLPDDWQISDNQNCIFQKSKSYEISSTDICIGEDLEFIIHVCYSCILLDHKTYTKCKKKHHLTWLKLYVVIISALDLKLTRKKIKKHLSSVPKTFDFSQNSAVPFYQVTFYHSISCVLLIDKPNEFCKNSRKFERNILSTTKKTFKKKIKKYYTSKDKSQNFTNFFRTHKNNNSALTLSNGKQRT